MSVVGVDAETAPCPDPDIAKRVLAEHMDSVVVHGGGVVSIHLPEASTGGVIDPYSRIVGCEPVCSVGFSVEDRGDGGVVGHPAQPGYLRRIADLSAVDVVVDESDIGHSDPEISVADVVKTLDGARIVECTEVVGGVVGEVELAHLGLADAAALHCDPYLAVPGQEQRGDMIVGEFSDSGSGFEVLERGGVVFVMQNTQTAGRSDPQNPLRRILGDVGD